MNIHIEARQLLTLMKLTHDPMGYLARYLVAEPTPHNAAIVILAWHQVTGTIMRHPSGSTAAITDQPPPPEWWLDGMHIAWQFNPALDNVALGEKHGMATAHDAFEAWLQGERPLLGDLDGPSERVTSPAASGKDGSRFDNLMVRKSAEDLKKERARSGGGHVVRSVAKRGSGDGRLFSACQKLDQAGKRHKFVSKRTSQGARRGTYGRAAYVGNGR